MIRSKLAILGLGGFVVDRESVWRQVSPGVSWMNVQRLRWPIVVSSLFATIIRCGVVERTQRPPERGN
jgi:hypothetical protein